MNDDVGFMPDLFRAHPRDAVALVEGEERLTFGELDALMDRIAASLQRDGVVPGDVVAVSGTSSLRYAAVFLGALRAGAAVAPLQPSATDESLLAMLADANPRVTFLDRESAARLPVAHVLLEDLDAWLGPSSPRPVPFDPEMPFNIIYSSGTTGRPKGIVQPHRQRWAYMLRGRSYGYGPGATTLCSTPLYSNTTLVSFFPAIALGGTVVLMPRFNARGFLMLSEKHRVTHAMLVPVQYQRILRDPDFERFDLGTFRMKFSTSAPLGPELKAEILRRWPGGLVESYGLTEGGGSCILVAHQDHDKLHTVGRPTPGHEFRILDDDGHELAVGEVGEVVGRSPMTMMTGYHGNPEATAAIEWFDATGTRFFRTGDLGRFDADGFLSLVGRKKDVIISGGFNIYAVVLEAVLDSHEAVVESAVVAAASVDWGETPVAFVVLRAPVEPEELRAWANARLGKTQRISEVRVVPELPRNTIGKVLKRELRERTNRPSD